MLCMQVTDSVIFIPTVTNNISISILVLLYNQIVILILSKVVKIN